MVVTQEQVDIWLENGQVLGSDEIVALEPFVEKFPFYAPTQAILAKAYFNTHNVQYEKQLRKASLTAENRLWLYNYIHTPLPITHGIETATEREKIVLKQGEGQILENESQMEPLHAIEPKLALDIEVGFEEVQNIAKKEEIDVDAMVNNENPIALAENVLETPIEESITEKIEEQPLEDPIVPTKEIITKVNKGLVTDIASENDVVVEDEFALLTPKVELERVDLNKSAVGNLNDAAIGTEVITSSIESINAELHAVDEMGFLDWLDYSSFNQPKIDFVQDIEERIIEDLPAINESNIEKTAEILQKFIANKPKRGEERPSFYNPEKMSELSDLQDNMAVSETLATVYLTQGEPEMAISVYEKLALKFPQKSTYFATLITDLKEKHRL